MGAQIGAKLTVSATHSFEETHQFTTTKCDIAQLLMRYEDSEAYLMRRKWQWSRMRWASAATVFVPNLGPDLCANVSENDPDCRCDSEQEARGTAREIASGAESHACFATLWTVDFSPNDRAVEREPTEPGQVIADVQEIFNEALLTFQSRDKYVAGVVGIDGQVNWVAGARPTDQPERLTLLSTSADAALAGNLVLEVGNALLPILAVGPEFAADHAQVRVTARHPGADEGYDVFRGRADVRVDQVTTVWSEVDLSELPDGTTGQIEVRVIDRNQATVGLPLVEPYLIEAAPVSVRQSVA